jgi:hypothetical protein
VGSILYKFSNQSLINNYDTNKFPCIHKIRADILGQLMGMKVIPRVAFYSQVEKRKSRLQISDTTSQNWTTKEEQHFKNQIIECSMNPTTSEEDEPKLRSFRYFNQWA